MFRGAELEFNDSIIFFSDCFKLKIKRHPTARISCSL